MLRRLITTGAVVMAAPFASGAAAQNPVPDPPPVTIDTVVQAPAVRADTIPQEGLVPRGAFIRALLVPGWGHLHIREPRRGAIFIALQGSSWFMLVKTMSRLSDVRDAQRVLEVLGRDSMYAAMAADTAIARQLADPIAFDNALAEYPGLTETRNLAISRRRHRQDWIVYTLVFTFAGAIDAYVAAHLKDFPGDFTAAPAPGGGASLQLSVPIGRRR